MAETPSTMLPLGTKLPQFSLPTAAGEGSVSSRDVAGEKATLVMFVCNHCPFVQHVLPELRKLTAEYGAQGVGIVAINSNDVEAYPQDAPEKMTELAAREGWEFPFLFDETQEVAKAFQAACTPDFFVFDDERRLAYRGRLDGTRPGSDVPPNGAELRAALDSILAGRSGPEEQLPSVGCNIKWKPGNEPAYFGTGASQEAS